MPNSNPFEDAPHHGRILETRARREAFARLTEGLGAREPFVLVTGEAGTGKTTLVDQAIHAWGARADVARVAASADSDTCLLETIVHRFRIEPPAGADEAELLACLGRSLAESAANGQNGVLVIDDAHLLAPGHFDEVQRLPDALAKSGRRIEVFLVGLPNLETRLFEAGLAPLARRIGAHCRTTSFSQMETRRYLHESVDAAGGNGRTIFPRQACREIFKQTHGVPRDVNALAAKAWDLASKSKSRVVTPGHVRAAQQTIATAPPRAVPAAPPPVADPTEETRVEQSVGRVAETPAQVEATTELKGDARVSDWVSRFIGPDEPRFGAYLTSTAPEVQAEEHDPTPVGFAEESDPTPPEPTILRSRPTPARGARPLRHRPPGSWTTPAAVLLVAITAVVLLVVMPRGGRNHSSADKAERVVMQADPEQEQPPSQATEPAEQPPKPHPPVARSKDPKAADTRPPVSQALVPKAPVSAPESRAPNSNSSSSKALDSTNPALERVEEPAPLTSSGETNLGAHTAERYTLEVATGLSAHQAESEADRLASESGLQVWVVTDPGAEWTGHRVVLGIYSSAERARNSAAILMDRGTLPEARVIPLPPRRLRH